MLYKYPKEYYKEVNRRYYLRHRERIVVKTRKYALEHPDKAKKNRKINHRRYYLKNRKKINAKTLEWQKNNLDKWSIIRKKAMEKYIASPKGIYRVIKQNARRKGRKFLTQKEFINWYQIQKQECFYCEIKPNGKRLTIDRMDNKKGYITGNLVLACFDCNAVKKDILSVKEMKIVGQLVMKKRWNK